MGSPQRGGAIREVHMYLVHTCGYVALDKNGLAHNGECVSQTEHVMTGQIVYFVG